MKLRLFIYLFTLCIILGKFDDCLANDVPNNSIGASMSCRYESDPYITMPPLIESFLRKQTDDRKTRADLQNALRHPLITMKIMYLKSMDVAYYFVEKVCGEPELNGAVSNSITHFFFSAYLSAYAGQDIAEKIMTDHEMRDKWDNSTSMDLSNNRQGIAFGQRYTEEVLGCFYWLKRMMEKQSDLQKIKYKFRRTINSTEAVTGLNEIKDPMEVMLLIDKTNLVCAPLIHKMYDEELKAENLVAILPGICPVYTKFSIFKASTNSIGVCGKNIIQKSTNDDVYASPQIVRCD